MISSRSSLSSQELFFNLFFVFFTIFRTHVVYLQSRYLVEDNDNVHLDVRINLHEDLNFFCHNSKFNSGKIHFVEINKIKMEKYENQSRSYQLHWAGLSQIFQEMIEIVLLKLFETS